MRKTLGLIGLIIVLCILAYSWEWLHWYQHGRALGLPFSSNFLSLTNFKNLLPWIGLFGILALAQSVVIITGGIDLSLGSVVCLISVIACILINKGEGWSPFLVFPLAICISALIGVWHGVLISYFNIQPFVVTLCGLFAYRSFARFFAKDTTQGFGNALSNWKWLGKGSLLDWFPSLQPTGGSPPSTIALLLDLVAAPLVIMIIFAIIVGIFLHLSPMGRHLFALGANEESARFSGIQTNRLKLMAYVICSLIAGIGGILFAFKVNSVQPSDFGSFYELYAVAGAVLGGCSLRGGTGNVPGVILGIALIMVLRNLVNILGIRSELEYVVIGGAILAGVCADEFFLRRSQKRRALEAQRETK
ncbi:MAG TPA: ABC transporter permease [Candidatus Hydrogenedens sp.]|nr:ABC transporter permease [Candidatus Hydrogenedens sp.]HOK10110.1 ABC transporter permease [Candidatus Hydrogenedens sp.]HOL20067.1 ABC transporter permease [Candidatus Hydrogenedens sp.]HPP59658.1 ABC transporter permease [Candidatus Hydrogenedens sp.]